MEAFVAGLITILATGVGALPVLAERRLPTWAIAAGSVLAGGMMVSVTVFELLVTGIEHGTPWEVALGFLLWCAFLSRIIQEKSAASAYRTAIAVRISAPAARSTLSRRSFMNNAG